MTLPSLAEIEAAAAVIARFQPPTPQYAWPLLAARVGAEVWVKHENHGPLGAFKGRGGLVYMDWLTRTRPEVKAVIAATRGNHGQSIADAARKFGLRATILVPHGNSVEKNAAMRALGAELIEIGQDFQEAVEALPAHAAARGAEIVPSFDLRLVAGVATYALELFRAAPPLDRVYVPIGMGSGICGVIAARDALGLATEVVGVTATGAPAFAESFAAGRPVASDTCRTIADGLACRVVHPTALAAARAGAARIVQVSDDAIMAAMRAYHTDTHNLAEGAGAAPLAAAMQEAARNAGRRIAVILCGGNVDRDVMARILAAEDAADLAAA